MPAPLIPVALSIAAKVLPLALAAGQAVSGQAARGRANQLAPPAEDPRINEFLNEVRARRRRFETGAAFDPLVRQLRQREQGALQAAGTRARTLGEFVTSAGRFRGDTTRGLTQAFTRGQEIAGQLFQQEGQIIGEQSQRELELQLLEQGREEARSATRFQSAGSNALGFAARIGGGDPGSIGQSITGQGQVQGQPQQNFIGQSQQASAPFAPQPQVPTGGAPGNILNQILLGQGNRANVAGALGL